MGLPLIKVGGLFFKLLSKYAGNAVKRVSKSNLFLRTRVCIPIGQVDHAVTMSLKARTGGYVLGKKYKVTPIADDKAADVGAEWVAESTMLALAAGYLYYEWSRGNKKKGDHERIQSDEIQGLRSEVDALKAVQAEQDMKLASLIRVVEVVQNKSLKVVPVKHS